MPRPTLSPHLRSTASTAAPSPQKILPLGALAAGFGLLGSSAFAQTPPAAAASAAQPVTESTLQPISVKAKAESDATSLRAITSTIGKGNQDLRDIPQSVTVVTKKLIEDRRTDTLKEVLHQTAGISFQAAEGGEEDIRLRGFSLAGSGDIYIDGVRDPAFYDRDTFNVDRIELLRGSASMLFGHGSTGGVVNQVNKVPFLNNAVEASATVGSGSYLRETADINRKLGDTTAARLNLMKTDATNNGSGASIDKVGIAPSVRLGIGTADEVMVSYYYLKNNNGINYGIPWLSGGLVPIDPKNYYGLASDYNHGSASYATLDHTHRFDNGGAWHTVLRRGKYDRDQRSGVIRFATPTTLATLSASTELTRGNQNKLQDLTSTYLQSDYQNKFNWFGRSNEVVAGVDLAREDFNVYGVTPALTKPRTTIGTPDDGASVDEASRTKSLTRNFLAQSLGVYAQDMIEIVPKVKLLAGLRWDRVIGRNRNATGNTTPLSRGDSMWSYRAGALYQPDDQSTYYASYGTSFNTSGDSFLYDAMTSKTPPEKSRNIEVGTKLDLFEGRLSTRVATFHTTKYNERNRDSPDGAPLPNYLLSGERHAAGLELDLAGRITTGWEVYGSYAWIPVARIDKASPLTALDFSNEQVGTRPSLTPRHSGTIWTTYQVTRGLRLGGGLNARSSQTPNRKPAGIAAPRFVTGDLMAEYTISEQLAFKFNVINVTNKRYADSLYTGHYIPGQGRTYMLTLTGHF